MDCTMMMILLKIKQTMVDNNGDDVMMISCQMNNSDASLIHLHLPSAVLTPVCLMSDRHGNMRHHRAI